MNVKDNGGMSLEKMKSAVFGEKPLLKQLIEKEGEKTVFEYAKTSWKNYQKVSESRKNELAVVFFEEMKRLFGEEAAKNATDQLLAHWFVSTAEHHDPVCHPFDVSGSFAQALVNKEHGFHNVLVLSCASISLNNSSFPRGIFWHTKDLDEERFHFLPWKLRRLSVYSAPAFDRNSFDQSKFNSSNKIKEIINNVYSNSTVVKSSNYSDQISRSNNLLWKKVPGMENINLFYIVQEKLVTELIIKYHLNSESEINKLLMNPNWRKLFKENFNGIPGAFDIESNTGTFLFWGLKNGVKIKLQEKNGTLISEDSEIEIDFTPAAIKTALKNKLIMPSMALSFVVLSFYYGLSCGGGFSQVDYLPRLKNAWEKILNKNGKNIDCEPTTNFLSADYSFVATQNRAGKSILSSAIDLIIYGDTGTAEVLEKMMKSYRIKDALDNLMPEFYTIVQNEPKEEIFFTDKFPICVYAK